MNEKMPAMIWPKSGNHATLTLMPKSLIYSWLWCAQGCVYTCTVWTKSTVVLLTVQLFRASHPSRGHHTWHTQDIHTQTHIVKCWARVPRLKRIKNYELLARTPHHIRYVGFFYLKNRIPDKKNLFCNSVKKGTLFSSTILNTKVKKSWISLCSSKWKYGHIPYGQKFRKLSVLNYLELFKLMKIKGLCFFIFSS